MNIVLHTALGPIHVQLDEAGTPQTVENFLAYARSGHYAGTIFHRIMPGFVVQGGGFAPGMNQKPCKAPIQNEAALGGKNVKGTLAMARTSDPHSATAQFFINLSDNHFLDHRAKTADGFGYCVFGKVTDGMPILEQMAKVKTGRFQGHDDVPVEEVVLERVEIVEAE